MSCDLNFYRVPTIAVAGAYIFGIRGTSDEDICDFGIIFESLTNIASDEAKLKTKTNSNEFRGAKNSKNTGFGEAREYGTTHEGTKGNNHRDRRL